MTEETSMRPRAPEGLGGAAGRDMYAGLKTFFQGCMFAPTPRLTEKSG